MHEDKGIKDDVICKLRHPITHNLSQTIIDRQKQRSFKDGDLLIKSKNEIRLDMAIRYLADVNTLAPNPVTPFLSLALNIEKALDSDSYEERREGLIALANDIINLALLAITDIAAKKMSISAEFPLRFHVPPLPENIEFSVKNAISSTKKILNSAAANNFIRKNKLLHRVFSFMV